MHYVQCYEQFLKFSYSLIFAPTLITNKREGKFVPSLSPPVFHTFIHAAIAKIRELFTKTGEADINCPTEHLHCH